MTQQEFNGKLREYVTETGQDRQEPTDEEYKLIEKVYTWHPSIASVGGKRQVAVLYVEFGMRIFKDMEAMADKAWELEDEIRSLKLKTIEMEKAYEELKR